MPARVESPWRKSTYLLGAMLAIALHQPANGAADPATAATRITVRKCVAADGRIAYQSQPCLARAVEMWTREASLESPRVAASVDAKPVAALPNVRSARRLDGPDSSRRQRCDAARIEAARKRDREWNRMGFDALSRLDAWVAERCR